MLFEKGDKVLFIGDSISDFDRARPVGEGLFNAWGTSYVADVGATLCCMYPELCLRIVNMGISGNQARDLEARAVFKIFCKCAKRGTQRISRARGLRLRACANAATASAAWPWQVAGEMLKWGTDGRPMKVLIPVTVGTISIAFSRRSVKAGVERTLSLRPRMVNRRSACQDT